MRPAARWFALALAALLAVRLLHVWFWAPPLSSDEAQYWDWSRHLDWAYYSKPPLIAWLIAPWTALFGDTAAALRSLALLLATIGLGCTWWMARRASGDPLVAWVAVALGSCIPLYAAGFQLMTTDVPLLVAWAAALALLVARPPGTPGSGTPAFGLALGLALGLGFLGKYAMAYLPMAVALHLLLVPSARGWLRTPAPWIALALGLAACLPVLWWNHQNDWVSFRHVAGQAGASKGWGLRPGWAAEFLGAQLGLALPVSLLLIPAARWAWRGRAERPAALILALAAVVPIALLTLKGLQAKVQPNWAAMAWLPAAVLAAWWAVQHVRAGMWPRWRRWTVAAAIPLALFQLVLWWPGMLHTSWWNLPPRRDALKKLLGWDELGTWVGTGLRPGELVVSDSYHLAAALAFYVPGQPRTICINLGRRMNQYDLWPGLDAARTGADIVFVREIDVGREPADPGRIASDFAACGPPEVLDIVRWGQTYRRFVRWRLSRFDGHLDSAPQGFSAY